MGFLLLCFLSHIKISQIYKIIVNHTQKLTFMQYIELMSKL